METAQSARELRNECADQEIYRRAPRFGYEQASEIHSGLLLIMKTSVEERTNGVRISTSRLHDS